MTLIGRDSCLIPLKKKRSWGSEGLRTWPSSRQSWGTVSGLLPPEADFFSCHTSPQEVSFLGVTRRTCACPWPGLCAQGPLSFVDRGQRFKLWCPGKAWMRVGRSWHKPIPAPGKGSKGLGQTSDSSSRKRVASPSRSFLLHFCKMLRIWVWGSPPTPRWGSPHRTATAT